MYYKICNYNSNKKDVIFQNAVILNLSQPNFKNTEDLIKSSHKCKVGQAAVKLAKIEYLNTVVQYERVDDILKFVSDNKSLTHYYPYFIYPLSVVSKVYKKRGATNRSTDILKMIVQYYNDSTRRKLEIPVEGLDAYAKIKIPELESIAKSLIENKLTFPEKTFNKILEKKFKQLDDLTVKSIEILKIGSGKGLVRSYQILVESYQVLATEINEFTPPNNSKDYIDSFKKSMLEISRPLIQKSIVYLKEAREKIKKENILSQYNYWFFTEKRVPVPLFYQYQQGGIIMDRGGRK